MSDEPKKRSRRWIWFLVAIGLLPLSFLMWVNGLGASFDRNPNPISITLLILSPAVAIAGVVWLLVLVVRGFWPRRK
jgi:uncharacterized membrane-anchored protein